MLEKDVIEPPTTKWASPIKFASKKDRSLRFCVHYRKLNALTVRDSYPLPQMDECINLLGEAMIFSTLDASSDYWQVEIDKCNREKTVFSIHGLYQFFCMPFELKNAPVTFQRAMDVIFFSMKCQSALVYLDDILVFLETVNQHLNHLQVVLTLLRNVSATLKLKMLVLC